jgi:hypothetical protein
MAKAPRNYDCCEPRCACQSNALRQEENTMSETPKRFAYGLFEMNGHQDPVTAAGFEPGVEPNITVANHIDSALADLGLIAAKFNDAASGIDKNGLAHPEDTERAFNHALKKIRTRYGKDSEEYQVAKEVGEHHSWV